LKTTDERLLADIIHWDVRNWSQAVKFWDRHVDWSQVHTCLELGGREGGLALWMALKGKSVVCSDLMDVERTAKEFHRKYQLDAAIRYQDIDATQIPYENEFDVIAFKSVLGGIGRNGNKRAQQVAIDQIHKALKPGGKLLFAENLTASGFHKFIRRKFVRWGDSWRYVTLAEVDEFLSNFTNVQIRTTGVLGAFGRTERQRRAFGAIDQTIVNRITPARWKYIVFGIAEKPRG